MPDTNIAAVPKVVRAKALKAFKGTASDQIGLRRVEIALVRLRGGAKFDAVAAGRSCYRLASTGRLKRVPTTAKRCRAGGFLRATGTAKWTYKLKRRLPKGSYVLVSRAVGIDDVREPRFSAADRNVVRFRVR